MKDVISKISVTTFFLTYLFLCGILYLISFWSTFDFDITNYIELLDIPKSFVFPLVTGLGITIFVTFIQAINGTYESLKTPKVESEETADEPKKKKKSLLVKVLTNWEFWLTLALGVCLILYKPRRDWVISIGGILMAYFCIIKFVKHPYALKTFPLFTLRLFVGVFIFYVPMNCFLIGKKNSMEIWKNTKYFKVKQIVFKKDETDSSKIMATKLLGKLGSNIFDRIFYRFFPGRPQVSTNYQSTSRNNLFPES